MLDENGLKDFVNTSLKRGYSKEQLRKTLISNGYDKSMIHRILPEDGAKPAPVKEKKPFFLFRKKEKPREIKPEEIMESVAKDKPKVPAPPKEKKPIIKIEPKEDKKQKIIEEADKRLEELNILEKAAEPKPHSSLLAKIAFTVIMLIAIAIILQIIILLSVKFDLFTIPFLPENLQLDTSERNFLLKANACEEDSIMMDIKGSKLLITSQGCVLSKRFTGFSPDEEGEIKQALSGKSMYCPYDKNTLTSDDLELTSNLDRCTGLLKDALYQLKE